MRFSVRSNPWLDYYSTEVRFEALIITWYIIIARTFNANNICFLRSYSTDPFASVGNFQEFFCQNVVRLAAVPIKIRDWVAS